MANVNQNKLHFVLPEVATVPPAGLINHMKDRWWICCPERGLMFYDKMRAPQCNGSEAVARKLRDNLWPWADVKFYSSVFVRIDPHDYV